jgi:hypothetical protein
MKLPPGERSPFPDRLPTFLFSSSCCCARNFPFFFPIVSSDTPMNLGFATGFATSFATKPRLTRPKGIRALRAPPFTSTYLTHRHALAAVFISMRIHRRASTAPSLSLSPPSRARACTYSLPLILRLSIPHSFLPPTVPRPDHAPASLSPSISIDMYFYRPIFLPVRMLSMRHAPDGPSLSYLSSAFHSSSATPPFPSPHSWMDSVTIA